MNGRLVACVVVLLLSRGALAQPTDAEALAAIERGNLPLLERLLEDGLPVDTCAGRFDESLLNLAVMAGQTSLVALLVRHGADVNAGTGIVRMTPLQRAANICELPSLRLLLAAGARIDDKPIGDYARRPLLHAISPGFGAKHDCYPVFLELLARGADPNAVPDPPLIAATYVHDSRYVKALLQHGAYVGARLDDKGVLETAIDKFSDHLELLPRT